MSERTCVLCGVREGPTAKLMKDSACLDTTHCELNREEAENVRLNRQLDAMALEVERLRGENRHLREMVAAEAEHARDCREENERLEDQLLHDRNVMVTHHWREEASRWFAVAVTRGWAIQELVCDEYCGAGRHSAACRWTETELLEGRL